MNRETNSETTFWVQNISQMDIDGVKTQNRYLSFLILQGTVKENLRSQSK